MILTPVNSSNIKAVGYDPTSGLLRVQFHSGGAPWRYEGVPARHYHGLMEAHRLQRSVGRYFHQNIRNRYAGRQEE